MNGGSRDRPVRLAVLGVGSMGRNHVRILSMLKGVALEFVSDIDQANGRSVAEAYGVPFRSVPELTFERLDGVVICTPTVTHERYVRAAAAAELKNLFVEKPLTDRLESSAALQQFAADLQLYVQVGFIERFNPAVRQLKLLLSESDHVINVDFVRTSKIAARIRDVDVIADLMIHDIDLALFLNGPIASLTAQGRMAGDLIAFACANLVHTNGRLSRIQASRVTDKKMRRIQATCTDKFIDCELLRKEIVLSREAVYAQRADSPLVITAVEETVAVRPEEALLAELQAFVHNCRGGDRRDVPGAEDAVRAMAVCEQIQRAIVEAGWGQAGT